MKTQNSPIKDDMSKKEISFLTLFLVFSAYQCILHLWFVLSSKDPRVLIPSAVAFIHDMLLLSVYCLASYGLCFILPEKTRPLGRLILAIGLIGIAAALSVYPRLLREFLGFPFNLFEADLKTSKILIIEYLGLDAFIPVFIALGLGVSMLFLKMRTAIPRLIQIIGFIIIAAISVWCLQRPSPQPLTYSLQMQIKNIFSPQKRIVPSLNILAKQDHKQIHVLEYPKQVIPDYRHILMIVLEGITSEDFESNFLTIPDGFFGRNAPPSVYYGNYRTTNLDSYTSLITMLTGIQVPYRSYTDDTLYASVNQAPGLTDYFNQNGYETVFVSTFENHPFIPARQFWGKIFLRKDFDDIQVFQSIGFSKTEKATEDRLAIDKMVNELKSRPRTFILHELAYGHSPEWQATIGKTQLEYYDEYLAELTAKLQQINQLNDTLFVIVSDHGDRAKAADAENYRVPLLIAGSKIEKSLNKQFLSHLDLPKIIFYYLGFGNHPADSNHIYCVGSSEKWIYGILTCRMDFAFIDNAKGVVLSKSDTIDSLKTYQEFQTYLDDFNYRYGNKN